MYEVLEIGCGDVAISAARLALTDNFSLERLKNRDAFLRCQRRQTHHLHHHHHNVRMSGLDARNPIKVDAARNVQRTDC